jgi:hypothetical protein
LLKSIWRFYQPYPLYPLSLKGGGIGHIREAKPLFGSPLVFFKRREKNVKKGEQNPS